MRPAKVLMGACAVLLTVGVVQALAQGNDSIAAGIQGNGTGFGPGIAYSVSPSFTVHGIGNSASFNYDRASDGLDDDFGLDLLSGGGILDYHPMQNGFHISVGALYNGDETDLTSTAAGFAMPGNASANLRGDLEFNSTIAPYLGVGYDTTFTSRNNWSFVMRAGVLYQGDPAVTATEPAGPAPATDLTNDVDLIEDDLSLFRFYPVISVGVTYRF